MALIKCHECKNSVSSKAPTCPHCGYKIAMGSASKGIILAMIIVFGFIGVLSFVAQIRNTVLDAQRPKNAVIRTPKKL